MTNYIGFGYLRIDVCGACYTPNHLFVSSDGDAEWCVKCHERYAPSEVLGFPNADTHPVLAIEIPLCDVCELPEFISGGEIRWKFREAYLRDGSQITAHHNCSRAFCDHCDLAYANTNGRVYRRDYALSPTQFSTSNTIEGESYCESCTDYFWEYHDDSEYIYCNSCESSVHEHNSGWWNGEQYCDNCIENNTYSCRNCSERCWDGDDHNCEEDDDESLIHSYAYRPSPFFFGEGKYHFGFELEVESRGNGKYEGAQIAQDSLGGRAYLKDDGSLNDGFEIVTHPHTLDMYHNDFNWGVLDKLKNQGYRSWNTRTCGLHVHVSRTAFGDGGDPWSYNITRDTRSQIILKRQSHELRFMKLVYDNQRQVERIAGRSNNNYATFQDKGNLVRKIKLGYQESGRYSAINTENDATIEVRVFKGSLRKERVLSALEFVHAAVEYTRDIKVTSKNHALSWLKFTGYVSANAELYPNLVTIMSESFASDDNLNEVDN